MIKIRCFKNVSSLIQIIPAPRGLWPVSVCLCPICGRTTEWHPPRIKRITFNSFRSSWFVSGIYLGRIRIMVNGIEQYPKPGFQSGPGDSLDAD